MSVRAQIADVSVRFAAPRQAVFDYLSDPANRPAWQSSLRSVDALKAPGAQPGDIGSSWADVTVVPWVRPRLEVTECLRGRRWEEIGGWHAVDAHLALMFTDTTDAGTEVRAVARLTVPTIVAPVLPIVRVLTPPALRSDLRRAAELVGR
ncbi:SRPBCC family protein [Gordonia sp. HNM0687]|uniref:SRPBCC family protein n=1 Tax=Gordonia mangrovi TaxID=2665643 RepID=A0A6L7GU83_9ACTN|nr:SRPBCC family protein [Gordonia mangrovi]MDY6807707.1 SRPBCC family protein [Actinomycetota bacterium]MXP22078.1 SRPBCC family protein [Gordonia mangrovi]UVF77999.1 SRPBCC family protein [Gordonia mangrovi]